MKLYLGRGLLITGAGADSPSEEPSLALKITEHGKEATLYLESLEIEGNDVPLRERVKAVIDQIIEGDEAVWQRMNGFAVGFGGAAYGGSGKMIEA